MPLTMKIRSMNPFRRKTSKKRRVSKAERLTDIQIQSRRDRQIKEIMEGNKAVNVIVKGRMMRMTAKDAKKYRDKQTQRNIRDLDTIRMELGLGEGKRKTSRNHKILYPNNISFKFYNVNQKKFVDAHKGPENVWKDRYKLGIWNNKISKKNIYKLGNLIKNNKKFILYIKVGSRYVKYTTKLGKEISKEKKTS